MSTQDSPTARAEGAGRAVPPGEPTTAELLKGLADDASTLVRQEILLARQEVTEGLAKTAMASGFLVAAGVLGLYALGGSQAGGRRLIPRGLRGAVRRRGGV